jgi:hypothetical protein
VVALGEKRSNAKAELNRRSQACEVLAGTGISRRGKSLGKRHTLEVVPPLWSRPGEIIRMIPLVRIRAAGTCFAHVDFD